jgi:uncharacterized protein
LTHLLLIIAAFLTATLSGIFGMAGGWVLDRMSDVNFKRWTAWIVTAIGVLYLAKAWEVWI